MGLLGDHYPQLRRYLPAFLEAFEFKAAPTARNIIEAVEVLRKLFAAKARSIPDDAPTEFIRRRWARQVFSGSNLDRRYYELCAVTELKNALRSGDIWVPGSRQFKDFEDYLLPRTAFESMLASGAPPLGIDGSFDRYWAKREALLRLELEKVDSLAASQQLPDAEFSNGTLKVTPLANAVPEEAEMLMRQAYARLPHLKVTDLLLEVDHWTNFTNHFTHLKNNEPAKDRTVLLTVISKRFARMAARLMTRFCRICRL